MKLAIAKKQQKNLHISKFRRKFALELRKDAGVVERAALEMR